MRLETRSVPLAILLFHTICTPGTTYAISTKFSTSYFGITVYIPVYDLHKSTLAWKKVVTPFTGLRENCKKTVFVVMSQTHAEKLYAKILL